MSNTGSGARGQGPRLWGGRFEGATDVLVERLNNSLPFDGRLWRHDIDGSIAHATMLGETGILSADDARLIVEGLQALQRDLADGAVELDPAAEDIHSAVEELLRQRIGPAAGRLHTARSRNDQVATDVRLWLRDTVEALAGELRDTQTALADLAAQELGETPTILPGYTHLQHAQPVLLAHHLLAYFWMFERDRERLADLRRRVNVLPLGAGALAGTTFAIDRERVAQLLGFGSVAENSLDAVSDRDFAVEFLCAASLIGVHCSRLAEELILWSGAEFGFVELDDSVTTGSSIMPQKKNPDVAELARGKVGRLVGDLVTLLTVLKGLPLAYNKDLQEDKEPLFDAADTLLALLPPFRKMVATARFRRERMAGVMARDFSTATDLADLLARRGVPFREAHEAVGRLVRHCIERGIGLEDLAPEHLPAVAPELQPADAQALTVEASVAARRARGGTAPDAVREQLARARALLSAAS